MAISLLSMIPLPTLETQHFHISPSVEGDREGLYDVARRPYGTNTTAAIATSGQSLINYSPRGLQERAP